MNARTISPLSLIVLGLAATPLAAQEAQEPPLLQPEDLLQQVACDVLRSAGGASEGDLSDVLVLLPSARACRLTSLPSSTTKRQRPWSK